MRACVLSGIAFLVSLVASMAEETLPSWREGELEILQTGEWELGEFLPELETSEEESGDIEEPPTLDLPAPRAGDIADPEIQPDQVPEEFWDAYFAGRPDKLLVDPRELLGSQDFSERLAFLEYHAGDSSIDLVTYVFKGDEDIPGEVREEELVERLFNEGRPAVVVYYHIGAPERSVLYLSHSLTDAVPLTEQRRALESSIMQAMKEQDAARQIEAFLVEMSIRIYWMEGILSGGIPAEQAAQAVTSGEAAVPTHREKILDAMQPAIEATSRHWQSIAAGVGGFFTLVLLVFWLRWRARYLFPEIEVEPRLGGSHAAGVGAVISFANAAVPPASQRDQAQEYLRRA
jgi:hypothetical protein